MPAFPFFKNLARLLLLNVLIKPLWIFGVERQVQNLVGHQAYGTYFSLLNLALVFSFLTDAGLSNLVNRQLASGAALDVRKLLRLKILLAFFYVALVCTTAWGTGVKAWAVLMPVLTIQVLLSFFNFLRSIITAHQLFFQDAWLSVIDKGLMLLLFLPWLNGRFFHFPITILLFLYVQLACTAIAVGAAFLVLARKRLLQRTQALTKAAALFRQLAPYALIILVMSAHNRLDGFLLERLHRNGAYEAGVYAAAYRLVDAANMLGYLVAAFLVPYLARHRAQPTLVNQTVLIARFGLLLFGSLFALFIVLFALPVQVLLYPFAMPYTAQVMQWCLPVLPAYLLLQVYGSVLTAMGQLKPFLLWLALALVVNSVLNIVLIPRFGAVGCCIAALTSQYLCAVGVYLFATRRNALPHDFQSLLGLTLVLLLLGSVGYAVRNVLHPLTAAAAGGVVVLLLLFAYLPRLKQSLTLSR